MASRINIAACLIVVCFTVCFADTENSGNTLPPVNAINTSTTPSPALDNLLVLAEKDDVKSQVALAEAYFKGQGVPQDLEKAFYWYSRAANLGDPSAQFYTAYFYKLGKYVEQDYSKAFYWYFKSAEQGYVDAQYFVAYYYEKGRGTNQDLKKSLYWYTKAAKQGDSFSQYQLAYYYFKGLGTSKDYVQAYYWVSLALRNKIKGAHALSDELLKVMTPDEIQAAEKLLSVSK